MSINLTLFDIETQNYNVRLITKPVLEKSKLREKKLFLLIDVDIKLLLKFKESFAKFCPVFPKNPKTEV